MGLAVSLPSVLTYAAGLLILFILGKLLLKPLTWVLKLICNALIGALLLIVVNLIGDPMGFAVVINPVTALIAGILGVPGALLLIFGTLIFG